MMRRYGLPDLRSAILIAIGSGTTMATVVDEVYQDQSYVPSETIRLAIEVLIADGYIELDGNGILRRRKPLNDRDIPPAEWE